MIRMIALLAFALSSMAFAREGQVVIRCTSDNPAFLAGMDFVETDLIGQYALVLHYPQRAPQFAATPDGQYFITNEAAIQEASTSSSGLSVYLQGLNGNSATLTVFGDEKMAFFENDCDRQAAQMKCERL